MIARTATDPPPPRFGKWQCRGTVLPGDPCESNHSVGVNECALAEDNPTVYRELRGGSENNKEACSREVVSQQEIGVQLQGRVQQPERSIPQIENVISNKLPRITENSLIQLTDMQWPSRGSQVSVTFPQGDFGGGKCTDIRNTVDTSEESGSNSEEKECVENQQVLVRGENSAAEPS